MNGPLAETKARAANSTEVTLETLKSFGWLVLVLSVGWLILLTKPHHISYKLFRLYLSTLDRMLDAILQDEEQGIELYTPNPDDYMYVYLSCICFCKFLRRRVFSFP